MKPVPEENNLVKEFDINQPTEEVSDDDDDNQTLNYLIKQVTKDNDELEDNEPI